MKSIQEMQDFTEKVLNFRRNSEREARNMCVEILKEMNAREDNKLTFLDDEGYTADDALCFTSNGSVGDDANTVKLCAIWLDKDDKLCGEVNAQYDDAETDYSDTDLENEEDLGFIFLLDFLLPYYEEFVENGGKMPSESDEDD